MPWGTLFSGDGTEWYRTLPVGIPSFTGQKFVEVDGTVLQFEQPPVVVNNRTLVPLRTIFESMGAEVAWDSTTSTVTAIKGDISIELSHRQSPSVAKWKTD